MKQLIVTALALAITAILGACATSGPEPSPTAAAATPAEGAAVAQNAEPVVQNAAEEVICRWEQRPGSNFRDEVCRTRAQIEARREEDQAAMRQMRALRSGSQDATQGVRPTGGISN